MTQPFSINLVSNNHFNIINQNIIQRITNNSWQSCLGNNIFQINDNNKNIENITWKVQINKTNRIFDYFTVIGTGDKLKL